MARRADYRCLACGHEWSAMVSGGRLPLKQPHSVECPACKGAYFKWVNQEDFSRA